MLKVVVHCLCMSEGDLMHEWMWDLLLYEFTVKEIYTCLHLSCHLHISENSTDDSIWFLVQSYEQANVTVKMTGWHLFKMAN